MISKNSYSEFTILGADGFIGSSLLSHLTKTGHTVYAPKRNDSEFLKLQHKNIIYCIGLTSDFRKRTLDTVNAHVCVLHNLLCNVEFESLTYLSSTRVYYGSTSTSENIALSVNPENLEDLYGISKLAGESLCHHSDRKNVKVARLSNIVGLRKDSDLFIDELLNEIVATKTLTLKSSLFSFKDYLWIEDAVRMIIALSISNEVGTYNIACGKNITNQTIINHLNQVFSFKLITSFDAKIIEFPTIDVSKFKSTFNYNPKQFVEFFPKFIYTFKQSRGIV